MRLLKYVLDRTRLNDLSVFSIASAYHKEVYTLLVRRSVLFEDIVRSYEVYGKREELHVNPKPFDLDNLACILSVGANRVLDEPLEVGRIRNFSKPLLSSFVNMPDDLAFFLPQAEVFLKNPLRFRIALLSFYAGLDKVEWFTKLASIEDVDFLKTFLDFVNLSLLEDRSLYMLMLKNFSSFLKPEELLSISDSLNALISSSAELKEQAALNNAEVNKVLLFYLFSSPDMPLFLRSFSLSQLFTLTLRLSQELLKFANQTSSSDMWQKVRTYKLDSHALLQDLKDTFTSLEKENYFKHHINKAFSRYRQR